MLSWNHVDVESVGFMTVWVHRLFVLLWYLPIALYIAVVYTTGFGFFIVIPLVPYLLLRTGFYYVLTFVFKVKRKTPIRALLVSLDIVVLPLATYSSMFLELRR